jgi:hypothetical protein
MVAAAEVGRQDLLERLFAVIGKSLEDIPALHRFLFRAAARGGHQSLVQFLLDEGVDINSIDSPEGWSIGNELPAARQVAALGNTAMLRYLLEKGAFAKFPDAFGDGPQPLEAAASKGRIEAVHLLLEYGADLESALTTAVREDRLPLIKSLVERYPELLRQSDCRLGRIALGIAITKNTRLETITFLVETGIPLSDGYEAPELIPLNQAKADSHVPMVVIDHLLALGARQTDLEVVPRCDENNDKFGVLISEASIEWTSLY